MKSMFLNRITTFAKMVDQTIDVLTCFANAVAPHAGAWIETISRNFFHSKEYVAPHTGAWIEK